MSWWFLDYVSYCKLLRKYAVSSSQTSSLREEDNFEELDIDGCSIETFLLVSGD
jgi:hypothetical protein